MNNFLRTVLAGLVLASTIGLAPDALSQSRDTRFEPTEISVRPGQARRVVVRYYRVGFIFCDKGEISSFRHGQDRIATYTAPDNPAGATDECRLFIGQRLYATLRVNLDSTAPVLEFSPSALEDVVAGASVPLTVTATDNVDGAVTPAVTCRSGSFDPVTSTYTAPLVTDIGASDPPWIRAFTRCTATAADAAGNRVEAILDVTVVPDGTPPDVTFTPATLDLSGATVPVTLTVSDNVGVTRLRVTCTQGSFDPDTNTYTAPDVSVGTAATCTATASDTAGNEREATLEITFEDTTAPVPVFSPSTLTVASGGTAVSTLTATDNVGVTTGPAVTCTQGSFNLEGNTVTYTAPDVSVNTVATCTATASDAAGNAGTATLTVSIVREATPPVVTFTPATLDNVAPGATVPVTLTATDNVGVTRVRVTCTQGSFDLDTNTYTAPDSSYNIKATCTATAMDSAGNEGTAVLGVTFPDTRAPAPVFGPSEITVSPGETAAVLFTVGDNVGVTEGPTVTCDQGSFNLEDNTFTYTAPVVSVDTMATCTATASDAAGNEGTATLAVSISTRIPDAEPPVMSFSLAVLAVDSGGTAPVTLTATDNVGVTEGPTVTCVRGSFADNTYTAPVVSADTAATCTATARDAAGNEGEAILRVFIVAPEDETPPSEALTADSDETPPVLTFSPDILTVVSGATAALTVTATDNVGVVRGPVVVCHPGTFSARDSTYTAPAVKTAIRVPCTATATDAAGNRGEARLWVFVVPDVTPPKLTFSPAALAVDSGATVSVTLTATDNVGIARGPTVTCTHGDYDLETNTYTAPAVSEDTRAVCRVWADDAAGNSGRAALTVSVSSPGEGTDMTPPVLTFSPAALTVGAGGTASVTFTATDNVGIVRGGRGVRCKAGSFSVMNNTYTAPAVREAVRDVCRAVAYDAAGNAGRAKLVVFVINPDRRRPVLTFSPNSLTVGSGATASVTFTAADNVGIAMGPVVTCHPGSFSVTNNTYTAPDVRADTGGACKARARDAAGNRGAANLGVSITAPIDFTTSPEPPVTGTSAPVVSFSPVSLTLASGGTGLSQVTATDSDDNVLTPTVSCTNGGGYDVGTGVFTAPTVTKNTFSICTAMATDGNGSSGSAMLAVNITSTTPVSCPDGFTESSGSPLSIGGGGDKTLCTGPLGNLTAFAGVLTESARIPYVEGVVYELSGRLDVGQAGPATCADDNDVDVTPVVLTVEAGVTIAGDSDADVLVVNRCHRIEAAGTSDAPIVLTSKNDIAGVGARESATGEWGGVVILGNGPINRCNVPGATGGTAGCENTVAGVTAPDGVYGGGSSASDSGRLEYVTVRHAGAGLNAGLTLGGVGFNTTVRYTQVHNSSGDGMGCLGGRALANYLLLTGNTDEQLYMDEGCSATIENVLGVQHDGDTSDNGIEVGSVAPGVEPHSNPLIRRFTLLAADNMRGSGIGVNTGARPTFDAGIVVDGSTCLDYETTAGDGVQGYSFTTDPVFQSILFDCPNLVTTGAGDDPATGRAAVAAGTNNETEKPNTLDGFIPGPTEQGIRTFQSTYVGAFNPAEDTDTDNWTTGWTRDLLPDPVCPEGTADAGFDMFGHNVCNVSGTVTDDLTLIRGNLYALQGRVDIGVDMGADGTAAGGMAAALVIEPGVTVFGRNGMDHMVVNRGSTITAEGTEADPIIFTSVQDVTGAGGDRLDARGEWGGLIILGRAPINFCNDPDATGGTAACERKEPGRGVDGLYGGAVSADDSGSLRYVQVKYAGSGLSAGFNPGGITFGGVGSETDVEHVQVHNAPRHGIGYFGGTVNSRRVVVTGSAMQLDIDHGYRGSLQYVIGVQGAGGVRSVNVASASPGSSPASDPAIANFTLMGAGGTRGSAIRVRRGAVGTWLNGVVTGGNACLDYEDGAGDGVEGFTPGSDPAFRSVLFDCAGGVLTGRGGVTGQEAVDADRNNTVTTHTLEVFVNGPAEAAVPAAAVPRGNGFLEAVDYIGAVEDAEDTWWQGWTCGLEESDPC